MLSANPQAHALPISERGKIGTHSLGAWLADIELVADPAHRGNSIRGEFFGEYLNGLFLQRVRIVPLDQPVHRQRNQAGRPARLTMRPHQSVSVFVGRHRREQTPWSGPYRLQPVERCVPENDRSHSFHSGPQRLLPL